MLYNQILMCLRGTNKSKQRTIHEIVILYRQDWTKITAETLYITIKAGIVGTHGVRMGVRSLQYILLFPLT